MNRTSKKRANKPAEVPESPASRRIKQVLSLVGFKKATLRRMKKGRGFVNPRTQQPAPGRKLRRRFRVELSTVGGVPVYRIAPRDISKAPGSGKELKILFLHGGAYMASFMPIHWRMISVLVERTGCTVMAPDYPLAPHGDWQRTWALVNRLYLELLAEKGPENLILMGDSAGGGLVLALAEGLAASRLPKPGRIILLSPWLDAAMENPDIALVDKHDPFLSPEALKMAGRSWAGNTPVQDWHISPLNGELNGLAPVTVFTGTADILNPDARKFRERMAGLGLSPDYREYPKMIHDWMFFKMPEAGDCIDQIVMLLHEEENSGRS